MTEHIILHTLSLFLDLGTLILYFHIFMPNRKKNVSPLIILLSYMIAELILYAVAEILADEITLRAALIRVSVSILTTFLLTLFYNSSIINRIFFTLSFQAIFAISELLSQLIVTNFIFPSSEYSLKIIDTVMILTEPVSFLLILLLSLMTRRNKDFLFKRYSALLLISPIVIVLIAFNRSILESALDNQLSYTLLIFSFMIINYVNYFILILSAKSYAEKEKINHILLQNKYQQNKYEQLSSAYKKLRKYQHDTKNRFLYISDCINRENYNAIIPYLESSLTELGSSYSRINTGNLVIDSFLSNFISITEENGIKFYTDLQLDTSLIPVNDYDLSIILGNLLDNAGNACNELQSESDKYIKLFIHTNTESEQFIIHIVNSYQAQSTSGKKDDFSHGYGLYNIREHVEKYSGILDTKKGASEYECSVIIPFNT